MLISKLGLACCVAAAQLSAACVFDDQGTAPTKGTVGPPRPAAAAGSAALTVTSAQAASVGGAAALGGERNFGFAGSGGAATSAN